MEASQNNIPQLKEFYIFNSKFGDDYENEIGKVLYFYPADTVEDNQLKKVGLCEAIIQFAETFNTEVPCESLHTQKARYIFFQAEPGYWFTLVITIPSVLKTSAEGIECIEYLNDDVQDNVFQAVLSKLYQKFILLNDKLETVLKQKGLPELKMRLKKYYDSWVRRVDANQSGVTDIFQGLRFLPLSRDMFLQVQCFINNLMTAWPQIKYVVLMQGEKLIWSGVDQSHIQLFYDYLANELLSQHFISGADKQSTFGITFKRESHVCLSETDSEERDTLVNVFNNSHAVSSTNTMTTNQSEDMDTNSFMTASTNTIDGREEIRRRYHMLIYKAEQSYLTLLMPDSIEFERQLLTKVEAFLNLKFTPMARELVKQRRGSDAGSNPSGFSSILSSGNSSDSSSSVKYLYFNNLNFAEKRSPGCQCDLETYKLLADLKSDLSQSNENGEIIAKMVTDNWIVAKFSNKREFYAIFNHKNSNLLEIDEEMKKLTDTHLTNIFFQE